MRIRAHSVGVLALVVCAGCPAPAAYQTAETLAPGAWQVGGGVGVAQLRDVEQDTRIPSANLEVFARRGLAPNLDVGARLYTFGAEASLKWRFRNDRWAMAILPGVSFLRTRENALTTDAWHAFATLPLLATRQLSHRWSVTVGPKAVGALYWSAAGEPELGALLGAHTLLAFQVGSFRILPELDISRTVVGTVPVDGWITHLGVGLAWQR
jgi:hypothetical protein